MELNEPDMENLDDRQGNQNAGAGSMDSEGSEDETVNEKGTSGPGRRKEWAWDFFRTGTVNVNGKTKDAFCRICSKRVKPRCYMLKSHLTRFHPDVKKPPGNMSSCPLSYFMQISNIPTVLGEYLINVEYAADQVSEADLDVSISFDDSSTGASRKGGRQKLWMWKYYDTTQDKRRQKIVSAICKLCEVKVSPKSGRLLNHLDKCHRRILSADGNFNKI